ncbi:MAG: hypothetical protein FWE79_01600 [Firmicutes bacterium]|nr:hypothetical protein [Bacillota bacterium]
MARNSHNDFLNELRRREGTKSSVDSHRKSPGTSGMDRKKVANAQPGFVEQKKSRSSVSTSAEVQTFGRHTTDIERELRVNQGERLVMELTISKKGRKLASIFNPMFPIAALWAGIAFAVLPMIIIEMVSSGEAYMLGIILPFFAVWLFPVWMYLFIVIAGIKFAYKTSFAITNQRFINKERKAMEFNNGRGRTTSVPRAERDRYQSIEFGAIREVSTNAMNGQRRTNGKLFITTRNGQRQTFSGIVNVQAAYDQLVREIENFRIEEQAARRAAAEERRNAAAQPTPATTTPKRTTTTRKPPTPRPVSTSLRNPSNPNGFDDSDFDWK